MNRFFYGILALLVLLVVVAIYSYMAGSTPKANAEALASCLRDKNITMYGAYWCPHCQNQKKSFGASWSMVPYIECTQETQRCLDQKVEGYPTWIFPDGKRLEGEVSLDRLATESGCPAPVPAL
jgi:hypothetical protein